MPDKVSETDEEKKDRYLYIIFILILLGCKHKVPITENLGATNNKLGEEQIFSIKVNNFPSKDKPEPDLSKPDEDEPKEDDP